MYSTAQAYLAYKYLKAKKNSKDTPIISIEEFPVVTIQLPVYNEQYVVERLIDAVANISYPKDKLEIQVLDDSTDETIDIVSKKVNEWQERGIDIKQVRRTKRIGYKAGALKDGLTSAKGAFIAVFDADFVPQPDFLEKTIPQFTTSNIGMVQVKWGHLNRNYSVLTRTQAFAIDAHFSVEQIGRNTSGCFINFNGTAGVWRKECITDAGNWQSDTLTEDLDLSYRAQMKGWSFIYIDYAIAPAELPPVMSAMKSQQYRWNKGAAETAKKLGGQLLRSKQPIKVKWQGAFHLLNSSVFIAVFISAVCSIPLLHFKQMFPQYRNLYMMLSVFLLSFIIVAWIFYIVNKGHINNRKEFWNNYLKALPTFLSVSMGMSLHNAIAVIEGYIGRKTPFIRTPKFSDQLKDNVYIKNNISILSLAELLMVAYFSYGIFFAFKTLDFTMLPFHLMLTFGFGIVSYYTIFHKEQVKASAS